MATLLDKTLRLHCYNNNVTVKTKKCWWSHHGVRYNQACLYSLYGDEISFTGLPLSLAEKGGVATTVN